jgi:hypothetical protein
MASALIGALRVNLGIDTAAFSAGLKGAGSKLAGFGALARKAIVPLTVAGVAAAGAVTLAVTKTINAADEMNKAAQKFGVPIEELSRLKYAADLSDISLESLGTSLGALSKKMAAAAGGQKEAAEAFAEAGIQFKNADGSLRSSSDVLDQLAAKFAGMPDSAEKTALAMQLLGKSGKEMIPLLNGGKEALAKMKAEADTFGQVFTAEMGANAEQFNDNITRLQGSFGNLAADLTERLLPYLAEFTDWMVREGPGIAERAENIFRIGAAFIHAGQAAAQFVRDVAQGLSDFRDKLREFDVAITETFNSIRDSLIQVGKDLVAGLWEGMKARWAELIASAKGLATDLVSNFKTWLGVQSPSTVFASIGLNLMLGLSQGINEGRDAVTTDLASVAGDLPTTFESIGQAAGDSFREFVDGLIDGSADAADALKGLEASIANLVLGRASNQIFSGITSALGIPGFAGGTANTGGSRNQVRGIVHGQEAVIPLPRGGGVPVDVRGGGGNVVVNIVGAPPGTDVKESQGPGGSRIIDVLIRDKMKGLIGDGSLDRDMRMAYGLSRNPRGR